MNFFTLGASGLLALGLPLAAPWLVQDLTTTTAAVVAPTPLVAQEATTTVAAPARLAATSMAPTDVSETTPVMLERLRTSDAFARSSDDSARELAELQARIAALQAQVAELTAQSRSMGVSAGGGPRTEPIRVDELVREAQERARVEQRDTAAARELLLFRSRSEQEEGRQRRDDGSAELERERGELQGRVERFLKSQRQDGSDDQRAGLEAELANLEHKIAADTNVAIELEAYLEDDNLSPRLRESLEEQLEDLYEEIDEYYEAMDEIHEDFESSDEESESFEWSVGGGSNSDLQWFGSEADARSLDDLGYLSWSDEDECEDCEDEDEGDLDDDEEDFAFDLRAFARGGQQSDGGAFFAPSAEGGGGWSAPRASGGGDVIVNVGGNAGGSDAEMIQLLREIRDEVRGLRADLRGMHGDGSMAPSAPRMPAAGAAPSAPRAPRRPSVGQLFPSNTTDGPATAFGSGPAAPSQPRVFRVDNSSGGATPVFGGSLPESGEFRRLPFTVGVGEAPSSGDGVMVFGGSGPATTVLHTDAFAPSADTKPSKASVKSN